MVEDMLGDERGAVQFESSRGRPLRFLLLTVPRSGTMMLANALEADSAVRLWNLYASNPDRPHASLALWEGFQWETYPPSVTHLGTTMHFIGPAWQPHCPIPLNRVWPMLAEKHDRTIILYRENLLRQFLSHQVGVALKSYDVLKPREEKGTAPSLILNIDELAAWVADIRRLLTLSEFFPGRLQVSYELLSREWNRVYRAVRFYLGLPGIPDAPPITYRQETRTLRAAVANYEDVATWCAVDGHPEWLEELS